MQCDTSKKKSGEICLPFKIQTKNLASQGSFQKLVFQLPYLP